MASNTALISSGQQPGSVSSTKHNEWRSYTIKI